MVEAHISNATVLWAQRKRFVYLKVEARNLSESESKIEILPPNIIKIDGKNQANGLIYHVNLELWHDIWIEKSDYKITDLCVKFNITKKWRKIGFWPQLLKAGPKFKFLKIDWDRWEDPEYIDPKNLLADKIDLEDYDDISQDSDSQGEQDEVPEHLLKPEIEEKKEEPVKKQEISEKTQEKKEEKKENDEDEDSEEDFVPEHLRD